MRFIVSSECYQLGLRAGAIVFRDVRITANRPEPLPEDIARQVQAVRARFAGPGAIRAAAEVASFHEILRRVGVNPRKDQSSVERLLAFALKRGDLPAVNSLVDAYNLVSIRTGCSLGAHDLDRIICPVSLRLFTGRESFTPLGESVATAVVPGEYGYVDAADRVLCRLDVRQAEFSKVTEQTRQVLLIVEGTVAHSPAALQLAVDEVIARVTHCCGGTAEVIVSPLLDPSKTP
jgi:DNA/RNA-binding domain of Phe-tRNA-synthetase-like protein